MFWRNRRKQLGLPASADVGTASAVLRALRQRAEVQLGVHVTVAAASVPHLVALYQDDVEDALEYLGLEYITIEDYFRPLLWETAVAYAGHGLGLCAHWQDAQRCASELDRIERQTVLSVHYAPNALTLSLAVLSTPTSLWEPGYRHSENFELGSMFEGSGNPSDTLYWETLRSALQSFLFQHVGAYLPAHLVIFTGISAPAQENQPFARLVLETLDKVQIQGYDVLLKDAGSVAAKGTAELVKRNGRTRAQPILKVQ